MDRNLTPAEMAEFIDHTLLKETATEADIKVLCEEAVEFGFKTVCIRPQHVAFAKSVLSGQNPKVITVVGFPSGEASAREKVLETEAAVRDGAEEIDMVLSKSLLKKKDYQGVLEDIQGVVKAAGQKKVKVILETCDLTEDEKITSVSLAKAAGAAFVKTSTGYGAGGATEQDIRLMRRIGGEDIGVKASGGIRNLENATTMLVAGANRLGCSASIQIINELISR